MACKTSYELHHHFPRLAEESGFTFNTHRPRVHIDWNKIKLIDLDSLVRERKFVLIEQHLNDILDCVFESEFDVRILDEGVMKMFRLAQLAVEYQQFCRHYLDRSVYVLREEINSLAQELDTTKKQLLDKEEELRKLKRRSRHSFKAPLPYGNDNIAAMILKTLSNKADVLCPTNADTLQHNKCNYCDKVFLNQLYLQSHIARRHAEAMETPQKENRVNEPTAENAKLSDEIKELKTKLKEMEEIVTKNNHSINKPNITETVKEVIAESVSTKNTKDAEVSTNNEDYLLNKFDEWKKAESEKYNNEIKMLKNHILETFNSIKEKQITQTEHKEPNVTEQLQNTIVQQGAEIMALKQELTNSKLSKEKESIEKNKESEAQIAFWSKRAEAQSKQYDALLQKLNDVAKDATECRALATAERERASQLQILLQQSLNRNATAIATSTDDLFEVDVENHSQRPHPKKEPVKVTKKPKGKPKPTASQQTLENLHKKAQELLYVGSISSSSESSSLVEKIPKQLENTKDTALKNNVKTQNKLQNHVNHLTNQTANKIENNTHSKNKVVKDKKQKSRPSNHVKDTVQLASGSPVRVVRAKITEEVNNRIVSFGVDPLKSRLPQNVYQKQRMELQQLYELKSKKNPSYEKTKYSILAKLDSNTEIDNTAVVVNEYVSPNKVHKPFRSISSVISNVKSKALSLVKLNENIKDKRKTINGNVTKRAMQLLSTPPESVTESPIKVNNPKNEDFSKRYKNNGDNKTERKYQLSNEKVKKQQNQASEDDDDSEDTTESEPKQHNRNSIHNSENTKSIDNLIKSPARRPSSADKNINRKYKLENGDLFTRTQSALNLTEATVELVNTQRAKIPDNENSSDDVKSLSESPIKNVHSDENIQNTKQTKGVLKNAASISSLNKKKVLFDMEAIQMKSVSASPSQSITEKSDGNEKYELGLVNLDGEEWDISSIENEPLKIDTKIQVNTNTRASPKITQLKQAIESQLARRNDTPSAAIVGGVDILSGPLARPASFGGSNTSVGSSILDESDGIPVVNHKAFVKSKKIPEKEDSEIDISEFSIDGTTHKNESF